MLDAEPRLMESEDFLGVRLPGTIASAPIPSWREILVPTPQQVLELTRRPAFADTLRGTARIGVTLYQGNRLLNLIASDRGRFIFANYALYLHYTSRPDDPASGLAAARLKDLCVETGLCSAGRAAAVIALMHWADYLESAEPSADRRVRLLRPTTRMIEMHRERWRQHFRNAAPVLPDASIALAHMDDPKFFRNYVVTQTTQVIGGFRATEFAPDMSLFIERNAGLLILLDVLRHGDADDTMPPSREVPVSLSAVAKQFHVSRSHVRQLLQDAEAAELLTRSGGLDMRVRVTPKLATGIRLFFAALFLISVASARYAREQMTVA